MNENLRALSSADADSLVRSIAGVRADAKGGRRERVLAMVGAGREPDNDAEFAQRLTKMELRPFSRRVRAQILAAGSPPTVTAALLGTSVYQARPYPFVDATQQTDQPEDDGTLFIDEIAIEFEANLLAATISNLRNHLGVKIHYPGGKKPRVVPLADVMQATGVYSPDAGVDNATAGSEAVVVGTRHVVSPPVGLLKLNPDEALIVRPKESEIKIELAILPWATLAAFTGEVNAIHYWYATFRGERLGNEHGRF